MKKFYLLIMICLLSFNIGCESGGREDNSFDYIIAEEPISDGGDYFSFLDLAFISDGKVPYLQ